MTVLLCALIGIYAVRKRVHARVDLWIPAAAAVLTLALFVAIDPEIRAALLLADYLGIDLIVTLCLICFRYQAAISLTVFLLSALRLAYRWGPVPGFWPARIVLTSSATWTAYAIIYPLMFCALAALCVACAARPWFR